VVVCLLTCDKYLPVNVTQIYQLYSQLQVLRRSCKFDGIPTFLLFSHLLASTTDAYNTASRIYDYLDQLSTYLTLIDIVFNDDAWKNIQRDPYWVKLFST
jgi:hypothetical protein